MKSPTLLALVLCTGHAATFAQYNVANEKVYKVDTVTQTLTESVEFDKPFYISLDFTFPIDPIAVTYASYRTEAQAQRGRDMLPVEKYSVSKAGKKYRLLIRMPGLHPGRNHIVSISRKLDDQDKEILSSIKTSVKNGKSDTDVIVELDKIMTGANGYPGSIPENYKQERDKSITVALTEIRKILIDKQAFIDQRNLFVANTVLTKTTPIADFSTMLYQCPACKVDNVQFNGAAATTDITKVLDLFLRVEAMSSDPALLLWKGLLAGKTHLEAIDQKMIVLAATNPSFVDLPSPDTDQRLVNLKKTLATLEMLLDVSDRMSKVSLFNNAKINAMLKEMIDQGYSSKDLMEKELKKEGELNKVLTKATYVVMNGGIQETHFVFTKNEFINGSSFTFKFDTRNQFQITPEFGLTYYGINNFKRGFSGVMPYVGFHVNFRAINRDIPFAIAPYKNQWDARLSAFVGFALASLDKPNERKDFFNKTSLMVGLGYRLGNAVRLVGGAMIFRHDDPNPVITNYTYAFTPYAGLSLDLSLYDLMRGINGIVTSIGK